MRKGNQQVRETSPLAGTVDAFAGPGDQLTIVMRKSRRVSGSV